MLPRTFCFIAVLVVCAAFASLALATTDAVNESSAPEEEKVLLDCQNTDYRTYIKCLKRQKRQHVQHGDGHPNLDPDCWETCFKKCETEHDCDKKCGHCLRKTKHKHQIITEYETECTSGNCGNDKTKDNDNTDHLKATNITTKIDIHNVIGEKSGTCCPTCQPPIPCNPPRQPCLPPNCPPIAPQVALVPQLSLGLSLSLGSPCWYPNHWPCVTPGVGIDCSGCRPPYYYKCDITCYSTQGLQVPGIGDMINPNVAAPCTSPHCVGGAQG